MAFPVLDRTRDPIKAGIEAKVPDVVKTGYSSALAQVIVAYYTQWLLEKVLYFILIILGQHYRRISGCQAELWSWRLGGESACIEASYPGTIQLYQVVQVADARYWDSKLQLGGEELRHLVATYVASSCSSMSGSKLLTWWVAKVDCQWEGTHCTTLIISNNCFNLVSLLA